jgi:hypothetical protein
VVESLHQPPQRAVINRNYTHQHSAAGKAVVDRIQRFPKLRDVLEVVPCDDHVGTRVGRNLLNGALSDGHVRCPPPGFLNPKAVDVTSRTHIVSGRTSEKKPETHSQLVDASPTGHPSLQQRHVKLKLSSGVLTFVTGIVDSIVFFA